MGLDVPSSGFFFFFFFGAALESTPRLHGSVAGAWASWASKPFAAQGGRLAASAWDAAREPLVSKRQAANVHRGSTRLRCLAISL